MEYVSSCSVVVKYMLFLCDNNTGKNRKNAGNLSLLECANLDLLRLKVMARATSELQRHSPPPTKKIDPWNLHTFYDMLQEFFHPNTPQLYICYKSRKAAATSYHKPRYVT